MEGKHWPISPPPPPYLNDYTNVVSFSQLTANHPSQNELKGDGISVQPVRKRVEAFISQDLMGHSCKSSLRLTRVLFLLDSWVEGVGGAWSVEDERERKGNFCYWILWETPRPPPPTTTLLWSGAGEERLRVSNLLSASHDLRFCGLLFFLFFLVYSFVFD